MRSDTFFRLFSRAPRMAIYSWDTFRSFSCPTIAQPQALPGRNRPGSLNLASLIQHRFVLFHLFRMGEPAAGEIVEDALSIVNSHNME
jgi:hypothetical protein